MMHILDGHVKTAEIDWKPLVESGVETRGISVKVLRFSHRGQSSMAVILVLFGSCLLFDPSALRSCHYSTRGWPAAESRSQRCFCSRHREFRLVVRPRSSSDPPQRRDEESCSRNQLAPASRAAMQAATIPISEAAVSGIAMASGIGRLRSRAAQAPFCSKC
jgi:hypothetical protein